MNKKEKTKRNKGKTRKNEGEKIKETKKKMKKKRITMWHYEEKFFFKCEKRKNGRG